MTENIEKEESAKADVKATKSQKLEAVNSVEESEKPLPKQIAKKGNRYFYRPTNDMLEVDNKDPRFVYRWVRANDTANLKRKLDRGYEIVDATSGIRGDIAETAKKIGTTHNEGSTVSQGDLVLAAIPKEYYNAYKKHLEEQSDAQKALIQREIQENVPNASGSVKKGAFEIEIN